MNGIDFSDSFINGGYGTMATSVRGDVVIDVELEKIPKKLPTVKGITFYLDNNFTIPAGDTVSVDKNTRFYGKATYSDGVDYPGYYSGGIWEYSLDGVNWEQDRAWGSNRFDYWPGWSYRNEFMGNDFDFVNGSYDLRLRVTSNGRYTTGDDVLSGVIHINGGASGGSGD